MPLFSMRAVTLTVIIVFFVSACGGGSSAPTSVQGAPVWSDRVDEAITQARNGDASAQQIAILTEAKESGDISLEAARNAEQATVDCMNEAGLDASYVETQGGDGELPQPGFRVRADAGGEVSPLGDACETQESLWVSHLYQVQPRAIEVRNSNVDKHMPQLLTCLAERGVAPDADASRDEIYAAATNEAISANTSNTESCLSVAGIGSL